MKEISSSRLLIGPFFVTLIRQSESQSKADIEQNKDIRAVLEKGLKENYSEVSVSIVECPDLTEEPFGLAAKGTLFFVPYTFPSVIG